MARPVKATNRLAELRHRKPKISQADIAALIPVSQTKYWRIENGYDLPTPEEKARIALILNVPESDLGFVPALDDHARTD